MKRATVILGAVIVLCLLMLVVLWNESTVVAQSGSGYAVSWWTVDGGGDTFSQGGGYALGGSIGQPDAAVWQGGGYRLSGGFWTGGEATAAAHEIYLPLVLRQLQ